MNVMRSGQTPARATRVCTMTPGSSKVISDRWRRRISGRIWLQLVKEYGQRIAGRAIAPHDFERRPDRLRVVERSDEHVGDIGPGDPVANGQRQGALRHHDSTLAPWTVEQNPGSDDGVLEPAAANLVLGALAPHQRIAFVEIEEHGGPGPARDTACCHVQEAAAESDPLSCGQRIHDATILRLSNVPLHRGTTTPPTGRKHHMSGAVDGAGNGVRLRDVTCDDGERRSEPRPRTFRISGEDTNRHTMTLEALRNEKARSSGTTDHDDNLVDTHEVIRRPTVSWTDLSILRAAIRPRHVRLVETKRHPRLGVITTPCAAFRGLHVWEPVVSCCECFPGSRGERRKKSRPPHLLKGPMDFHYFFLCSILL